HGFALAAAEQALSDAGARPTATTAERWGCAVGTGMMGVDFAELVAVHAHSATSGELDATRLLDDASANNPLVFCRSQSTTGLSLLTRRHDIRGYATSVHTACASGGQA
ncbi:MAG: beta-ketoacyl-[acyl-carrier-protein] synthase family protein, partial [Betaproteobacteria bacterium]